MSFSELALFEVFERAYLWEWMFDPKGAEALAKLSSHECADVIRSTLRLKFAEVAAQDCDAVFLSKVLVVGQEGQTHRWEGNFGNSVASNRLRFNAEFIVEARPGGWVLAKSRLRPVGLAGGLGWTST